MTKKDFSYLVNRLENTAIRTQTQKINPGQTLSLCMITKNEEAVLERALKSAHDIVDEIIIVDTGSTDKTVEIAKSFGAKVFFTEWTDDFSAARNESLKHATGQWVLVMDADECIPDEVKTNLRVLLPPTNKPITYMISITNFMRSNDPTNTVEHYMVRLFRRLPEVRFFGVIHEQVYPTSGEVVIPKETFYLEHYGYMDEVMDKSQKIDQRNIPLIKKALEQTKESDPMLYSFYCYYLGNSLEDPVESQPWYRKAIDVCPDLEQATHIPITYLDYLSSYYQQGNIEEALTIAKEAVDKKLGNIENFADFWETYGMIQLINENYEGAITHIEKALNIVEHGQDKAMFNVVRSGGSAKWNTLLNLGTAYVMSGDSTKSEQLFQLALEAHPGPDKSVVLNKINSLSQSTQLVESYLQNELSKVSNKDNPYYLKHMSNIHLKNGRPFEAIMLQSQSHGPEKTIKTALQMAAIYEQEQNYELAKQTYNGILSLEPEHFDALIFRLVMNLATACSQEGYEDYLKLKELCGEDQERWFRLGELNLKLMQVEEAEECFDELLKIVPNDLNALLAKAYILQLKQDNEGAQEALRKLSNDFPDQLEPQIQLGNLLINAQQFKEAEECFKAILDKGLDASWYTPYALGVSFLQQEKFSQAETYLKQAEKLAPQEENILNALALLTKHSESVE